ncbi:MAG: hypothetical protein GY832_03195 [Chloroflexi bacterium]|nr:hypothetical protein [Chloroflexota bacterium]
MRQKLVGVAVSIIVFFIFAELVSLAWYFLTDGELFYVSDRQVLSDEDVETRVLTKARFHPFFGYFNNSGNNHNFYFADDYPFIKDNENQYIIGVFGGSVALHFGNKGKERFIENLKRHPFFEDKEIIVLIFCAGGYKQPQQLLILNYYLAIGQELDMVINIDGFNEVALSSMNNKHGIDASMPSVDHIMSILNLIDQTTLTSERLESLAKISRYKMQLSDTAQGMSDTNIASVYFVLDQFHKILYSGYQNELLVFNELESSASRESLVYIYPVQGQLEDSDLFESIALTWATSSILMHQALQGRDIPYFHFLQPNQYYSNKVFSKEETKIAFIENHPYGIEAKKGYPILLDKDDLLEQNGVNFYSAVDIFDDELDIIYSDSCCHYNQFGNDLFADFVVDAILETGDF